MNKIAALMLILFLFTATGITFAKNKPNQQKQSSVSFAYEQLTTPEPSIEAEALFRYIQSIKGEKILSGQMCIPRGINELEYISSITGKQPALRGMDLENEQANEQEIKNAIDWWTKGGIPVIMWNWSAPSTAKTNEVSIEKCFQEGTPEFNWFWEELKTKANHLETLRDAHVPVIWCPFHEANGNLFWWGKQGPMQFKKLWQTMYNYFVHEREINNLIWVLSFSEEPDKSWFPGDAYVDIVGASSYKNDKYPRQGTFAKTRTISADILPPIAYQQCAKIPDPDECKETGAMWSWFMQRHTIHLENIDKENLLETYHNKLLVNLDEVPEIVNDFSSDALKRKYSKGTFLPFHELKSFNIGTKSGNHSTINNHLEIVTNGKNTKERKDNCYFAFKQMQGDFDISVQVHNLSDSPISGMAGIMARVDLSKGSQHVFFMVFPNSNPKNKSAGACQLNYRTKNRTQSTVIYPNLKTAGDKFKVEYPNSWIRLKRRGNIFKSYISNDNIHWYTYSVHEQHLPDKLLVGLAAASQDTETETKVEFKNLEITWE